jgi:signal transduction histidine kinase
LFEDHIFPEDSMMVRAAVQQALDPAGKGVYDIQFRIIRHSDHVVRWIRAQGKAYFGNQNKAIRFIGTVLDITDEKIAQVELERIVEERTAELKKTNAELEQYAYIASHDLQEPLRKIQTFTELLKDNLHDEAAIEKYYDKINTTASKMSVLIKDVLNYSKLSQVRTLRETVDLEQVLKDVMLDFELMISEKKALVKSGPLPVIRGDGQQIRQLFGNLFSNSLKFCEGIPEINITAQLINVPGTENGSSSPAVQITFKDNGIGFEQKYAEQIFMAFKRLNNRQLYSGTGIGMALCKKIVERHRGTISANSEPGKGTEFTIVLPL